MQAYPITAMALCNGMGDSTAAVLAALRAGRSGLGPCPAEFELDAVVGAIPTPLPPLPGFLGPVRDTRQARIAAVALAELQAPLDRARARWGADRVAVVLGTSTGGIEASETAYAHAQAHGGALPAGYDVELSHALDAVLHLARVLGGGLGGPAYVVSTACSSSAKVFASAQRLLAAGLCDAVLVGGVDSLCRLTVRGFAGLEVLSSRPCRPFSSERAGINIGEGAALLLVERTGDGPARLLGVGESSDAYHMTSPHPEGLGARLAMERALRAAGLFAADVDHVNAHGTGTKQNDSMESAAIRAVFAGAPAPAVVATKGYTGHMLGAAGATEVAFVVDAIAGGYLPASVGADPLDETLAVDVVTARRDVPTRAALSNSFAFGGSNCSVLVGGPA
ncbi:3-oxoacyl-[acyl-carrier-protein] synthase-1 [Nannocystis exedens]|uniref:3-oxoacyl-[acyl-carrier-protein] synthase-1 n=1 Tax=Nannocystis exedens TaxID=54 RepID=A0A1I2ECS2_9BACT|nr:beta-ketoacyl-ACP synthase [Nannocystis exedens]PCC74812.1 beta-ketoacyl-[acyl-carrier-protein] synthase II [Nannocystis exedens]SFE90433.1 3-oxoacyl-[acyl-carrier-protein] synthase-1 [Nannocystis exedens]